MVQSKTKSKEYRDQYQLRYQKRKFEELKDKERELSRLRLIINRQLQFFELKQGPAEHAPVLVVFDQVDGINVTVLDPSIAVKNISSK